MTEPTAEEVQRALKFHNRSNVSLDDAVESVKEYIASGGTFTMPNADLLVKAAMETQWD